MLVSQRAKVRFSIEKYEDEVYLIFYLWMLVIYYLEDHDRFIEVLNMME